MIRVEDLVKVYPMGTTEVRALAGVSLRIEQGEFVALVGPSGSGKSTMMHLLGCLDRPTAGTYHLLDQKVSDMSDHQLARARNAHIGFVFQTFNLISRMSAWENVAVPLFYARQTATKASAMKALERVGLANRATHAPNELSGGERQRVAIARSIVNNPALILADEPTGNLDTKTGHQIMQIFRDLHAAGTTIILVTHELDIAAMAQRIVGMRDGKMISDGAGHRGIRPTVKAPAADLADLTSSRTSLDKNPAARDEVPDRDTQEPPQQRIEDGADGGAQPTVIHPNARRAMRWVFVGLGCLAALIAWLLAAGSLARLNPTLIKTAHPFLVFGLLIAGIVAPILGIINGRRGARWVRIAPAKYTGLKRAVAAQWVGGFHLLIMLGWVGLAVLVAVLKLQGFSAG
ncbi:MAG: ABC transporter ATP-binding protein [Phycisphaerae bacterium]